MTISEWRFQIGSGTEMPWVQTCPRSGEKCVRHSDRSPRSTVFWMLPSCDVLRMTCQAQGSKCSGQIIFGSILFGMDPTAFAIFFWVLQPVVTVVDDKKWHVFLIRGGCSRMISPFSTKDRRPLQHISSIYSIVVYARTHTHTRKHTHTYTQIDYMEYTHILHTISDMYHVYSTYPPDPHCSHNFIETCKEGSLER